MSNAGPSCQWAEVGTERTETEGGIESRRGARIRDWVSLEVFLWLQPKVSQGRVPGPEAATARAESGETPRCRRVTEGQRW